MSLAIIFNDGTVVDGIKRLESRLDRVRLAKSAGQAIAVRIQQQFMQKEANHKRFPGGEPTRFWEAAAQSVTFAAPTSGGEVLIKAGGNRIGLRQRWKGGTISKPNGYLTIPARSEAYGHRAREFNFLKFEIVPGQGPCLVVKADVTKEIGRTRKDGTRKQVIIQRTSLVFYWLRKNVTQKPDPSVMPTEDEIGQAAVRGVKVAIAGGKS